MYSIGGLTLQGYQYRYDQLQRLTLSVTQRNPNTSTNSWSGGNAAFAQSSAYVYDANGNITNLGRYGNSSTVMDSLTYKYAGGSNQLQFVNDNVSSGTFSVDVDDQSAGNYAYTEIGELKQDNANEITDIEWRVDGKIKKIERSGNRNQVEYVYDAFGRRVLKLVKPTTSGVPNASSTWTYTYYVNDAQGNIMATYVMTESAGVQTYKLKEEYIYGASMLGNVDADVTLATYNTSSSVLTESTPDVSQRVLGEKEYLLQNHVMSNLVVVSDRFVPHNNSGTIDYYTAQVISESDYYPYGMLMLGRNNNATNFRNGFQNQQNDDEIFNTAGSLTTAEFWAYDTRLGRRWNVDPVTYAWQSTYAAFNNNPVMYVDPLGLEGGGGVPTVSTPKAAGPAAAAGLASKLQPIIPKGFSVLMGSLNGINNSPYNGLRNEFGFDQDGFCDNGNGTCEWQNKDGSIETGYVIKETIIEHQIPYLDTKKGMEGYKAIHRYDRLMEEAFAIGMVGSITAGAGAYILGASTLTELIVMAGEQSFEYMTGLPVFNPKNVGDILKWLKNVLSEPVPFFMLGMKAIKNTAVKGYKTLAELGLQDGMKLSSDEILEKAQEFLGVGYTEAEPWRFVSADGKRVFRMGDNDILGKHGGGPHVNFEVLGPNPQKPGKLKVDQNFHIYLSD